MSYGRRTEEENRKRHRATKEEVAQPKGPREDRNTSHVSKPTDMASTSKPKPVRRDLLSELGEVQDHGEERRVIKTSTQEWVQKSFPKGDTSDVVPGVREKKTTRSKSSERTIEVDRASWYRKTEKEAAIAKEIYDQNWKWEIAEKAKVGSKVMTQQAKAMKERWPETKERRSEMIPVAPIHPIQPAVETNPEEGEMCLVGQKVDGPPGAKAQEVSHLDMNEQLEAQDMISPLKEIMVA